MEGAPPPPTLGRLIEGNPLPPTLGRLIEGVPLPPMLGRLIEGAPLPPMLGRLIEGAPPPTLGRLIEGVPPPPTFGRLIEGADGREAAGKLGVRLSDGVRDAALPTDGRLAPPAGNRDAPPLGLAPPRAQASPATRPADKAAANRIVHIDFMMIAPQEESWMVHCSSVARVTTTGSMLGRIFPSTWRPTELKLILSSANRS
jgi:hypothetical protein